MESYKYEVIVSNVGTVYQGNRPIDASKEYGEYKQISLNGYGRAGGEDVILLCDGEIKYEHRDPLNL